jgi:hypothetical protein
MVGNVEMRNSALATLCYEEGMKNFDAVERFLKGFSPVPFLMNATPIPVYAAFRQNGCRFSPALSFR